MVDVPYPNGFNIDNCIGIVQFSNNDIWSNMYGDTLAVQFAQYPNKDTFSIVTRIDKASNKPFRCLLIKIS